MGFFDVDHLRRVSAGKPAKLGTNDLPQRLQMRRLQGRPSFPQHQTQLLLDLLGESDHLRRQQESVARKLRGMLTQEEGEGAIHPSPLQQSWSEFIAQGGITRDDLVRYMQGDKIGGRVRIKRHLRLVRSKPQ
jgi:hypothetical protein